MRRVSGLILLVVVAVCAFVGGCTDDDDDNASIPAGAAALQTYIEAGLTLALPGLGRFDAILPFLVNPASPGASGITFQPDLAPGSPPHAYLFTVSLDGDDDGTVETSITGRCVLTGDPANAGPGFGGAVDIHVQSMGGFGDFAGAIDFLLVEGGTELSGTGTFTETMIGNTTTIEVAGDDPLMLEVAAGGTGSTANACAYRLDGTMDVEVSGASGSLSAVWNFLPTQRPVAVTGASYTDPDSTTTELPNSSFWIPCGEGTISDWAGVYLQDWSCLPAPDYGQAELTITVTGANTIHIVDEDPPGSGDFSEYDAVTDPGHPHVARGFFLSGPEGFTYREDFTWTLSASGDGFSDVAAFVYQEGPNQGSGGLCASSAERQP